MQTPDSMLQATLKRLPKKDNYHPPVIICHEEHRFLVAEQVRQLNIAPLAIILEPAAKNTAPAIALAAHWASKNYKNPLLLVLPADHYLEQPGIWQQSIEQGICAAEQSLLVTFGIPPTKPATGYGYIEAGDKITQTKARCVTKFIEKPEIQVASKLIKNPNFVWNSGQFLFKANTYIQEINKFHPQVNSIALEAINHCKQDLDFIRPHTQRYIQSPAISIDYAVMEKSDKAAVVDFPATLNWSDLGSWQAIWEQSPKDQHGNYINGNVIAQQTKNCLLEARHRLIATVDIEDLAVIETSDAILIAKREQSEGIKNIVKTLKQNQSPMAINHRQMMRPWGWYDSISQGDRFQVKRIFVNPGMSLSLQMHHHRSEHWVVVKGIAEVTKDHEVFTLHENESTFIPIGIKHQLKNIGKIPLEIIEVQSGSYLGEDDIVRFQDEHGRVPQDENNFA